MTVCKECGQIEPPTHYEDADGNHVDNFDAGVRDFKICDLCGAETVEINEDSGQDR